MFQGIGVLPEYAPLLQFFVPRHHVMIGCDKLYVHIQRVQASFCTRRILGLNLTSLAYADMASEHLDRKVRRESYSRYDQHEMFTIDTTPSHVMIGHGLVDVDHVITWMNRGMSM